MGPIIVGPKRVVFISAALPPMVSAMGTAMVGVVVVVVVITTSINARTTVNVTPRVLSIVRLPHLLQLCPRMSI